MRFFVIAGRLRADLHATLRSDSRSGPVFSKDRRNRSLCTSVVFGEESRFFSERGRYLRQVAAAYVDDLLTDPDIVVHPQSHQTFLDGFALFKARLDKGYSQTDCISMNVTRQEEITEVLTDDDHFTQEGFIKLL